jgi:hypothetical protein
MPWKGWRSISYPSPTKIFVEPSSIKSLVKAEFSIGVGVPLAAKIKSEKVDK